MANLIEHATGALPILPAVLVILLAVVATRVARRLLQGGPEATTRADFRLQIVNLAVVMAACVLFLVVLPVGPELRGQLLNLFGFVMSAAIALASSTFVGNIMAGVMLKTVRNFRTGDFVRVGENFGRVTERGLLSTEIQTEDRDLVTLPNLLLVTNPVKVVRKSGAIISAELSLGYDVHHERVEALLIDAVKDAGLTDPFVLVLELGDFSVTYRAAGLLEDVKQMITVRSRLRTCMLDRLHGAGVEIVSPNFMNQRPLPDGTRVIPARVRPAATVEEATVEQVAFDKAEEAESLEQLVEAHRQTREAIAALADGPGQDEDPERRAKKQQELTRRLARLEKVIEARQQSEADAGGAPG